MVPFVCFLASCILRVGHTNNYLQYLDSVHLLRAVWNKANDIMLIYVHSYDAMMKLRYPKSWERELVQYRGG